MATMNVGKEVREFLRAIGKKGGLAKAKRPRGTVSLPAERRSAIARNAARARWKKMKEESKEVLTSSSSMKHTGEGGR